MCPTEAAAATFDVDEMAATMSKICRRMRDLKPIHARLIRLNPPRASLLAAKLLRFAAVSPAGDLHYARRLFSLLPRLNTFFYNTLIRGHAKSAAAAAHALLLFNCMRRHPLPPDEFSLTFLLKACSRSGDRHGNGVHGLAIKLGFGSFLYVQNATIHFYAMMGFPGYAARVFEEMAIPDVVSWSGLVLAYARVRDVGAVLSLFHAMPEKDVVSWTAVISCCEKEGHPGDALRLYRDMVAAGEVPDEVTLVSVVAACASLGDLEAGLSVHRYAQETGLDWMVSLCNALIDMYSKCGCLGMAWSVFESMERKSLISWNSMISACAVHGLGEEAMGLFTRMIGEGKVVPDGVTFLGLLNACAHKGWVDEGRRLFMEMARDYLIEAGVEHYGCMVDLLGRAGYLEEAYELIVNMPIPSNDVVWGALLGACRIHGNVKMGERVVRKLTELKPCEGGYYVLQSNLYDDAGKRAKAMEIREDMKNQGAKKTLGFSWVGSEH